MEQTLNNVQIPIPIPIPMVTTTGPVSQQKAAVTTNNLGLRLRTFVQTVVWLTKIMMRIAKETMTMRY